MICFKDILQLWQVEAVGDTAAVGAPLLRHHRNTHLLLNELAAELPGMALLERCYH